MMAYRTLQAITGYTALHGVYASRFQMRIHCSVEHCTEVGDCSADGQLGLWDMIYIPKSQLPICTAIDCCVVVAIFVLHCCFIQQLRLETLNTLNKTIGL